MPRYPEYQIHSLDTHGYGRIIQTIDGKFYDGWGNTVTFTLFGKEVSINVEGAGTDSTDGGNINVTNNNTTNNTDLFKDLQDQLNNLTKIINEQKTTIDNQNTVPTGTIIMWGGSEAGIPSGWKLCDGSILNIDCKLKDQLKVQLYPFGKSGEIPLLPDLRSRFVVGAGNSADGTNLTPNGNHYGVGDKGGKSLHTLTPDETPLRKHNHSLMSPIYSSNGTLQNPGTAYLGVLRNNDSTANITFSGPHTHVIRTHYQSGLGSGISTTNSSSDPKDSSPDRVSGGNHKHGKESFDGYTGTSETNTTILPHENRPPYFALCYIIKL